jgi:hypothetical protein
VRQSANAVADRELMLLAFSTPFWLFPGIWSPLGRALIGVTWGAGPRARGPARNTQDVGHKNQDEPSGGESLFDALSPAGSAHGAVHGGHKAEERIPLVPYEDEEYEAGLEDRQHRAPDVARIERTVDWKPSRSLEETLGDTIESYALPCGSHA